jgi:NADH-quinone oxidoreductase subunit C
MQALYDSLKDRFAVGELTEQRPDLAFVSVPREQLRAILLHLRDREGFTHLVLLTAVDWIEDDRFQLTYLLCDRRRARDLGLRVMLPRMTDAGEQPEMESIHDIWPTAATYQRELREMFGIRFPDSPGVDEDFILEGWREIPPYRRDFDTLKYSNETFAPRPGRETRDPAEHMKQQLYPDRD